MCNEQLSGVHKFQYLRTHLSADTAQVIDDWQELLPPHSFVEGKPYKLVNSHMDALMNFSKPVIYLASLQGFHDRIESHMRALKSLGKLLDTQCWHQWS